MIYHGPFKCTFGVCNDITIINFEIGGRLSRLVELGWADYRQMELRRRHKIPGCQVPVPFIADASIFKLGVLVFCFFT